MIFSFLFVFSQRGLQIVCLYKKKRQNGSKGRQNGNIWETSQERRCHELKKASKKNSRFLACFMEKHYICGQKT